MTLIGKSKLKINEKGNAYLHSKQRVGISKVEDTNIARAIVYDQHIIDSLYLSKKLNESEHNACDKYLGLIATSGAFLQSSAGAVDKIFTGQSFPSTPRSIVLIKVQRELKKECGEQIERKFWRIMVDSPKELDDIDIQVVKTSAKTLLNYWYISLGESPVVMFQQALEDRP